MKLQRTLAISASTLALAAALVMPGAAFAAGKEPTTRVKGTIVKIDRETRTLTIQPAGDASPVKVVVPEGTTLRLDPTGAAPSRGSRTSFERAHRGLNVDLVVAPGAITASTR